MNDSRWRWLNEPREWQSEGDRLSLRTAPQTDFWRATLVDYIKDTGHFYYEPVSGDFVATVRFSGEYHDQYDQAGLFVRVDDGAAEAGVSLWQVLGTGSTTSSRPPPAATPTPEKGAEGR